MSWYSKILDRLGASSNGTGNNHAGEPLSEGRQPDVRKELFLDEMPPQAQEEPVQRRESALKEFLDTDYSMRGFNDGYESHSAEVLENNKRNVRARFRYIIDQLIDEKNGEIFSLKNHLIDTAGISDRVEGQLRLRIEELQARIKQLERDKELSAEDEGLVMVPIHSYHNGFVKGIQAYQEKKLFALSTGVFN